MIVKLLVDGGSMQPGPAIAQKLGPLGINIGKVIQDVNDSTKNFKGMKVPVELIVNAKEKNFEVKVLSPPTAELIKKELGIEKASGEHKKIKAGNLAIEQVIKIAKIKFPDMLVRDLKKAVRSVAGSCVSLGVLIESEEPKKIEEKIKTGEYDELIKNEVETPDKEKLEKLRKYFEELRTKQEAVLKKEAEEKAAAEEAKKAQQAAAPAAAVPGATEAKKEDKKEEKK